MRAAYEELIRQLARHLALDPERLAQTQELVIDDLAVGLLYEGDDEAGDFLYFSELGVPAPEHAGAIHRVLLEANGLWIGTGGGTLGLQPSSGEILLSARLPLWPELTPEEVTAALDVFVEVGQFWRRYIDGSLDTGGGSRDRPLMAHPS